MRKSTVVASVVLVVVATVACVSAKMGETNLEAVNKLAELAVAEDPANVELANKASADAAALADASETSAQITTLGVPDELAQRNHANIVALIETLDETKPEHKAAADAVLATSLPIAGRTHAAVSFKKAAHETPWTDTLLKLGEMAGAAVGLLYAGTRGKTHVARWWNTPSGPTPPAPPAA